MLFTQKLEIEDNSSSFYIGAIDFISRFKFYLLVVLVSVVLLLFGQIILALIFSILGSIAVFSYSLFSELSSTTYDIVIDGYDLIDIIDDLES